MWVLMAAFDPKLPLAESSKRPKTKNQLFSFMRPLRVAKQSQRASYHTDSS